MKDNFDSSKNQETSFNDYDREFLKALEKLKGDINEEENELQFFSLKDSELTLVADQYKTELQLS